MEVFKSQRELIFEEAGTSAPLANALSDGAQNTPKPVPHFCIQLGLEEKTALKITAHGSTFHWRRQTGKEARPAQGAAQLTPAAPDRDRCTVYTTPSLSRLSSNQK